MNVLSSMSHSLQPPIIFMLVASNADGSQPPKMDVFTQVSGSPVLLIHQSIKTCLCPTIELNSRSAHPSVTISWPFRGLCPSYDGHTTPVHHNFINIFLLLLETHQTRHFYEASTVCKEGGGGGEVSSSSFSALPSPVATFRTFLTFLPWSVRLQSIEILLPVAAITSVTTKGYYSDIANRRDRSGNFSGARCPSPNHSALNRIWVCTHQGSRGISCA